MSMPVRDLLLNRCFKNRKHLDASSPLTLSAVNYTTLNQRIEIQWRSAEGHHH